jgi:hypothetical protein
MTSTNESLDAGFAALKAATADALPPARTDRAVADAIARAERKRRLANSVPWREWLLPAALAAAAAVVAFLVLPLPPKVIADDPAVDAQREADNAFVPVVPMSEIAEAGSALVVPASMPRMMLAQLGLPLDPARAGDEIDAELLVRRDGSLLAVRFVP